MSWERRLEFLYHLLESRTVASAQSYRVVRRRYKPRALAALTAPLDRGRRAHSRPRQRNGTG